MPLDSHLSLPARTDRAHARRRVRGAVVGVVLVALVTGAGVAYAGSSSSPGYRTATVGPRSTDQVLNGVGTIEPVAQATVAFPAAGTVATVAVKPGDTVTTGSELASLDQASLDQAVTQAQANLDQAALTLQKAENGQTVATNGNSGGSSSGGTAQPAAFRTDSGDSATQVVLVSDKNPAKSTATDVAAAQKAVEDAQKKVDQDLATADQAYATAQQVCADITSPDTSSSSSSSDASTSSSDASTSSSSDHSSTDDVTACAKALDDLLQAQHEVSTSQAALASALTQLDALLAQQAVNPPSGGGTGSTTTRPNTTANGSNGNSAGGNGSTPNGAGGNRSSSTPSAADLAAYQQAVDAAQANLTVAQQALLQATIVSPIDGTVVAVNMKVGDSVTAGSTTATIVIAGSGGYEAVTMMKVTDLPKLKVGQAASVQPDGARATITGKITSIGLVSTSSTTGTTYPVTISLTGDTSQLHNGATATIAITTATGDNGLAVPSSAVHNNNGTYTVTVLDGDTTKDVTVQVGAIGSEWTQITTGLTAGQTVVLADLNQPLPNSATTASNGQQQNRFGRGGAAVVTRN